jgi:hypothetical protein
MRKFTAIAKVGPEKFVKYRTNKPENLINFLITKFGACYYCNFYHKTGDKRGMIAGTWGKNKGYHFN